MARFKPGQSGNPGGRPKVLAEVQEVARQHMPAAMSELARLALKAKNETTRVAAIRELLDRAYGKPRQGLEIAPSTINPIQQLLDEIDECSRGEVRFKNYGE